MVSKLEICLFPFMSMVMASWPAGLLVPLHHHIITITTWEISGWLFNSFCVFHLSDLMFQILNLIIFAICSVINRDTAHVQILLSFARAALCYDSYEQTFISFHIKQINQKAEYSILAGISARSWMTTIYKDFASCSPGVGHNLATQSSLLQSFQVIIAVQAGCILKHKLHILLLFTY